MYFSNVVFLVYGRVDKSLLLQQAHKIAKNFKLSSTAKYSNLLSVSLKVLYMEVKNQKKQFAISENIKKEELKNEFNKNQEIKIQDLKRSIYIEFMETIRDNTNFRNIDNLHLYNKTINELKNDKNISLSICYSLITEFDNYKKYNKSLLEKKALNYKLTNNKYNVKNIYDIDLYCDSQYKLQN